MSFQPALPLNVTVQISPDIGVTGTNLETTEMTGLKFNLRSLT
jgi:hypothetical protein